MSLINEALKKAQTERQVAPPPPPRSGVPVPPGSPPQPRKKRNYLWGFLMAIIFVGLFSAVVSTFLVYQILGPEEASTKAEPAAETAVLAEAATPESPVITAPEPSAEPQLEPSAQPAEPATTPPASPAAEAPVEAVDAIVAAEPVEVPVVEAPAPPAAPAPTVAAVAAVSNPAIWTRLELLEIRGIMSGGTKVLIHDLANGKTKAFTTGELLDGALGLRIAQIKPSAILFQDNGGYSYTKTF